MTFLSGVGTGALLLLMFLAADDGNTPWTVALGSVLITFTIDDNWRKYRKTLEAPTPRPPAS